MLLFAEIFYEQFLKVDEIFLLFRVAQISQTDTTKFLVFWILGAADDKGLSINLEYRNSLKNWRFQNTWG